MVQGGDARRESFVSGKRCPGQRPAGRVRLPLRGEGCREDQSVDRSRPAWPPGTTVQRRGPQCPVLPEDKLTSQTFRGPGHEGKSGLISLAISGRVWEGVSGTPSSASAPAARVHLPRRRPAAHLRGHCSTYSGKGPPPCTGSGSPASEWGGGCDANQTATVSGLYHSPGMGPS